MIIYFASKSLSILGLASTNLSKGFEIIDDTMSESIDTGVAELSATILWTNDSRFALQELTATGNYALIEKDHEARLFTIVSTETDTAQKAIIISCEDAGLDLINEVAPAFEATSAHTAKWYIEQFLGDSDFEIGINEIPELTRTLKWDGEQTVTERIRSIATQFDNAEISYSYEVDGMEVTAKHINIWKKRGVNIDRELRLDREINSFRIINTISNLVTGITVTGGIPEGKDAPITLNGYTYDDGDVFLEDGNLYSRKGAMEWGRAGLTYIMGSYKYDTTSQQELCARAVSHLYQYKEPQVNYEVDIERGLENCRLGDRVNLVDDKGEVYLSARILELKESVTANSINAVLGEYLIKDSGISEKVLQMAQEFADTPRVADYSLTIISSGGSDFLTANINTTLTARVLYRSELLTATDLANRGMQVNWYSGNTLLGNGLTYTVTNASTINITARLEDI